MWVRKLMRVGNSEAIVISQQALDALGWERGDFIMVQMQDVGVLVLTKFNPAKVSPEMLVHFEGLPEIV